MPCIYITTNLLHRDLGIQPWRYIGSDQRDNPNYYGSNKSLVKDIKQLGKSHFVKEVILNYDSIDNKSLRQIEVQILKEYNVKQDDSFYNLIDQCLPGGGKKGMKHKRKVTRSQAWIDSVTGKKRSQETRLKISQKKLGSKHTLETRQKMSQSNSRYYSGKSGSNHPVTGYKHSAEERMRRSVESKKRWESPEIRKRVRDKMARSWLLCDPEGNEFIVKGLREWCRLKNIPYVAIRYNRRGWTCQQIT
jgi:hypothetical protein